MMKKIEIFGPAMCCPTGLCGTNISTELMRIAVVIETLKKQGFWIVGLDLEGKDNNLDSLSEFNKIAIIIGSEAKGMRRLTNESCDFLIRIPISSKVESLNASNAASIIFYALRTI